MTRPSLLLGLSIVSLGLFGGLTGCDDAPTPGEVRTRISTDLVHVIAEVEAASADGTSIPSSATMGMVDRALGGTFGGVLDRAGGTETTARVRASVARVTGLMAPRPTREHSLLAPEDPVGDQLDAEATAQWLNDNLFTDANHQGDGIYTVPAALVCTETQYDDLGNPIGEAVDPDCAQGLAQLQLRIRVTENDDALRFALQLGPDHDEPLAIGLAADALSLTVDLDEAEDAIRALAPTFAPGEPLPSFALSGEATATLEVIAAAHVRAALAIDRALSIKFADAGAALDGADAFRFASAQAQVFEIRLDGSQQTSAMALGLGATTLHVPDLDGAIELDLPGATAAATFAAGQPLQITGIGLGDRTTTLKVGGAQAIGIDLNPADGRSFDATITDDPTTGTQTLAVTPRLDLRTQLDHAVLGDEPPVYDVTRVLLDGSLRTSALADRLEVVTGSLELATNPASYGFTATAGQCVTGTEVIDLATDRYYTQWSTGTCP